MTPAGTSPGSTSLPGTCTRTAQAAYIFAMDETNKRGIIDGYVVQIFEKTWDEICVYNFMHGFYNAENIRYGFV
jgi:hypothetical protein